MNSERVEKKANAKELRKLVVLWVSKYFYMYFRSGSSVSSPSIVFSYLEAVNLEFSIMSRGQRLHCKHDPSTHYQPRQSRNCSGPESEDALISENLRCTLEAMFVLSLSIDGLHPMRLVSF